MHDQDKIENMNAPIPCKVHESMMPFAMKRLEELAAESQELAECIHSTFESVLFRASEVHTTPQERREINGSDLARSLIELANRIEGSFVSIRASIDSSDL